jgi:hypothetical protein
MKPISIQSQVVYDQLEKTLAGFSKPDAVRKAERSLLAAINGPDHPTLRARIELACAALGSISAGAALSAVRSLPQDAFEVPFDDVCDALVARVEFWMRENIKLHLASEAHDKRNKNRRRE